MAGSTDSQADVLHRFQEKPTMPVDDAIVRPIRGKNAPKPGSLAVMVSTRTDLDALHRRIGIQAPPVSLYNSRLYAEPPLPALTGPIVGAPYAAMVLETLISWGVRRCLFFGWCGAIDDSLKTGDILLPGAALIDEGTSRHYNGAWEAPGGDEGESVAPSRTLTDALRQAFSEEAIPFHDGMVWTTDAIYRETPEKVFHYRGRGAVAVEMETSALCSVARYRGVALGVVLVVSDELSSSSWRPGFKDPRFAMGRETAMRGIDAMRLAMEKISS